MAAEHCLCFIGFIFRQPCEIRIKLWLHHLQHQKVYMPTHHMSQYLCASQLIPSKLWHCRLRFLKTMMLWCQPSTSNSTVTSGIKLYCHLSRDDLCALPYSSIELIINRHHIRINEQQDALKCKHWVAHSTPVHCEERLVGAQHAQRLS